MGLRQRPFTYLIVWSVLALLLAAVPAYVVVSGISATCISEWCGLPQTLAMVAISAVALVWLLLVLLTAWLAWNRQPGIAAWGALAASLWLLVESSLDANLWFAPGSMDSPATILDQLVLILLMGVSLVPMWRLSALARPAALGRLATVVAGLATLATAYGYVVLGYTPFNGGPQLEFLAYLAFCASLSILVAASWQGTRAERPGLALVGGGALFYLLVGGYDYAFPADATSILLIAGPFMALGWLWIGLTWLRSDRTRTEDLATR